MLRLNGFPSSSLIPFSMTTHCSSCTQGNLLNGSSCSQGGLLNLWGPSSDLRCCCLFCGFFLVYLSFLLTSRSRLTCGGLLWLELILGCLLGILESFEGRGTLWRSNVLIVRLLLLLSLLLV